MNDLTLEPMLFLLPGARVFAPRAGRRLVRETVRDMETVA